MAFTFNPLWKTLVDKNMNKEDLRKMISASPSTIAKLSKDEYVALRVIDDICQVLNVKSISQVIEYIPIDINIIPESELEMLENAVNVIIDKKNKNERISRNEMVFLYELLINTINSRSNLNETEHERFYKVYLTCIRLLPDELSSQVLATFISNINTTPR